MVCCVLGAYGLLIACGGPDAPEGAGAKADKLESELPLELVCEDTATALTPRGVTPAPAPADASADRIVEILEECADSGPYNPFNICTTSCNRVHARCRTEGVGCRTATLSCEGSGAGHAINIVQIPGKGWCAVDTTASTTPPYSHVTIYEPCFDDPRKVVTDQQLACRIMGVDTDGGRCPCSFTGVVDEPQSNNYDPKVCKQENPTDLDDCRTCCTTYGTVQYCRSEGIECKDFIRQCLAACQAPLAEAGAEAGRR
jgi:hypothetical protein